MYQGEPSPNDAIPNRPIRMLPFALAAAVLTYAVLSVIGLDEGWTSVLAAIAGGGTLGRLTRRES
jgi:hypothetical protein